MTKINKYFLLFFILLFFIAFLQVACQEHTQSVASHSNEMTEESLVQTDTMPHYLPKNFESLVYRSFCRIKTFRTLDFTGDFVNQGAWWTF